MSASMENLAKRVSVCIKCPLAQSRTNAVPGIGNSKSDVIFVGEAPGRNEDLIGKPFVGTAGKILSEVLDEAGLKRDDVYITNVVKCRPPNNRRPLKEERDSCHEYLSEELGLIHPKVVCILGNTAFNSLLDGDSITKNRGKLIKNNNQLYFVTVHPAAIIYNPELKKLLKEDIKFLVNVLNKLRNGEKVEISQ